MNGPSTSRSSPRIEGMLTAFVTTSPSSAAATCSATITPARSCASAVDAARCGVTTTWSSSSSGPEYGSAENTSSAAPADLAGAERIEQRLLVDELAARGVDEADPVLHARERRRVEQARGLAGEREVQRDEVRPGEELFEGLGARDPELPEALVADVRVVHERRASRARRRGGRPAGRSGRSRARRASCPRAPARPIAPAPSAPA